MGKELEIYRCCNHTPTLSQVNSNEHELYCVICTTKLIGTRGEEELVKAWNDKLKPKLKRAKIGRMNNSSIFVNYDASGLAQVTLTIDVKVKNLHEAQEILEYFI